MRLMLLLQLLLRLRVVFSNAVAAQFDVVKVGEEATRVGVVQPELKVEFLADGEVDGRVEGHHQRIGVFGDGGRFLVDPAGDRPAMPSNDFRRILVGAEEFDGAALVRVVNVALLVADDHVQAQHRIPRVDVRNDFVMVVAGLLLRQLTAHQQLTPLDQSLESHGRGAVGRENE